MKSNNDRDFVKIGSNPLAPSLFGPKGIIVGGLYENQLEILDFALDNIDSIDKDDEDDNISSVTATPAPVNIPVIVLADTDTKKTLKELLENRYERDHVLPNKPISVSRPFTLFSGFSMDFIKKFIFLLVNNNIEKPAVAITVPNNLDKEMKILMDEIINDFELNKKKQ